MFGVGRWALGGRGVLRTEATSGSSRSSSNLTSSGGVCPPAQQPPLIQFDVRYIVQSDDTLACRGLSPFQRNARRPHCSRAARAFCSVRVGIGNRISLAAPGPAAGPQFVAAGQPAVVHRAQQPVAEQSRSRSRTLEATSGIVRLQTSGAYARTFALYVRE